MKKQITLFFFKTLILTVITLTTLILIKSNKTFKKEFYLKVYESNFSFANINNLYKKNFGSLIPFLEKLDNNDKTVFKEKLVYDEVSKYKDGAELTVSNKYLVPSLKGGLIVFVGEKEGYGKTVIINQINGVDVWYSNLNNISVKLYDYIEDGSYIGETTDNKLYLVFKKDGKTLDYQNELN